jgi:hypothetical protein
VEVVLVLATAKILQKRGARVFLCDINEKFIDKINKNIKIRIKYLLMFVMLTMKNR